MTRHMLRSTWPLLGVLALWAAFASAAQADETTFRDLVRRYTQDPKNPPKELAAVLPGGEKGKVVALEYTVLLKNGEIETPVDPNGYKFRIGDQMRVRIQPMNQQVFVYVFHQGASGKRECLLPTETEAPPTSKPGESLDLPHDGYFEFTEPAGEEKLIVVASLEKIDDLAALSSALFKKPAEQRTPAEKAEEAKVTAAAEQMLESIREKNTESITYRDFLSVEKLKQKMDQTKTSERVVLEEPPHGKYRSIFVMTATAPQAGQPTALFTIPLRSVAGQK